MQDAVLFELLHALLRIAQALTQNLTVMLAQGRRIQLQLTREFGEAQREPGNIKVVHETIMHCPNRAALAHVRVIYHLFDTEHRSVGDAVFLQPAIDFLIIDPSPRSST
jgi:hypothetical protein